jgi:hypothetical protein
VTVLIDHASPPKTFFSEIHAVYIPIKRIPAEFWDYYPNDGRVKFVLDMQFTITAHYANGKNIKLTPSLRWEWDNLDGSIGYLF